MLIIILNYLYILEKIGGSDIAESDVDLSTEIDSDEDAVEEEEQKVHSGSNAPNKDVRVAHVGNSTTMVCKHILIWVR